VHKIRPILHFIKLGKQNEGNDVVVERMPAIFSEAIK
jgi:hypothetical protein